MLIPGLELFGGGGGGGSDKSWTPERAAAAKARASRPWGNPAGWTANGIANTAPIISTFTNVPVPGAFTWGAPVIPTMNPTPGPDISGLGATAGPSYTYTPPGTGTPEGGMNSNHPDVINNILSAIYGKDYKKLLNYDPYAAMPKPKPKGPPEKSTHKILRTLDPVLHVAHNFKLF